MIGIKTCSTTPQHCEALAPWGRLDTQVPIALSRPAANEWPTCIACKELAITLTTLPHSPRSRKVQGACLPLFRKTPTQNQVGCGQCGSALSLAELS